MIATRTPDRLADKHIHLLPLLAHASKSTYVSRVAPQRDVTCRCISSGPDTTINKLAVQRVERKKTDRRDTSSCWHRVTSTDQGLKRRPDEVDVDEAGRAMTPALRARGITAVNGDEARHRKLTDRPDTRQTEIRRRYRPKTLERRCPTRNLQAECDGRDLPSFRSTEKT